MKIFALSILFFALTIASCTTETGNVSYDAGNYSIRMIDGCEYIEVETGYKQASEYNYTLTHKGNCRNPIHKCPCQGQ